jgi:hypothetical protein
MPELVRHQITEASADGGRDFVAVSMTDDGRVGVWTDTGEPAILTRGEAIRHIADVVAALLDV